MSPQIVTAPVGKGLMNLFPHPDGVRALVGQQWQRAQEAFPQPLPGARGKTALVIGSTSLGYGSATALAARAAGFERIIGLGYENPPKFKDDGTVRPVGAGWYVTAAAHELGIVDRTYFADVFSDATRERVMRDLKEGGVKIDAVFYSIASDRRTYGGRRVYSTLGVIGEPFKTIGMNYTSGQLSEKTIEAATLQQIADTVFVMGGDDPQLWVDALLSEKLLANGALFAAYSYTGPSDLESVARVYRQGAIGEAKKDLEAKVLGYINDRLASHVGGKAVIKLDPAVVTLASAAIPSVLMYLSAYLAVAGGELVYRDPLDVKFAMIKDLYGEDGSELQRRLDLDHGLGRLRYDDAELNPRVQEAIRQLMAENAQPGEPTEQLREGLERFRARYNQLYGFGVPGVNYNLPTSYDIKNSPATGVVNLLSPELNTGRLRPWSESPPVRSATEFLAEFKAQQDPVRLFFKELFEKNDTAGIVVQEEGEGKGKKTVYSLTSEGLTAEKVRAYNEVIGAPDLDKVSAEQIFAEQYGVVFATLAEELKRRMARGESLSVIHASEQPTFTSPIPLSVPLEHRAWISKKSSQETGVMFVIDRELKDGEKNVLGKARTYLIVGAALDSIPPAFTEASILEGTEVGRFTFTQESIDRFADRSGDHNLPHIVAGAQSLGLSRPVAHGMFNLGIINRGVKTQYGARFKGAVFAGEEVVYYQGSDGKITGVKRDSEGRAINVLELK